MFTIRSVVKTMTYTRLKPSHSKGSRKLRKSIGLLYGVDIFEGIEPKELNMILDETRLQTCPVGTILFAPEDTCEHLYILRQGGVELYRLTSGGKRLVTRRISPGSMFGIMGLLGQTMQGSFAETTEDSTIYVMTREDILALLGRRPEMVLHILEAVGNRLCILEERLVEILYGTVSMRIAHFLLTNVDPDSGILTNITHEEIGDIIGAVRQTVTETLSRMRKQGLILTSPRQIHIIDRHELERIVQY
jgi:CRP/FNR family cyclic AMP-dependent transcriptional regulator